MVRSRYDIFSLSAWMDAEGLGPFGNKKNIPANHVIIFLPLSHVTNYEFNLLTLTFSYFEGTIFQHLKKKQVLGTPIQWYLEHPYTLDMTRYENLDVWNMWSSSPHPLIPCPKSSSRPRHRSSLRCTSEPLKRRVNSIQLWGPSSCKWAYNPLRILEEIRLTSRYGLYPMIYRVLYIPAGCLGFLPSTYYS